MKLSLKSKIFCLFALFFTVSIMAQKVSAQDSNVLQQQVTVDVSAETVFAARQQAFGEARNKAWQKLLTEMVASTAQQTQAAKLPDDQVEQFVSSISVVSEQTTDVRYKATFAVEFDNNAVRRYLENNGIGFTLPAPKRVLIPLFIDRNNNVLIWESTNPWRQAWETYAGEIPLILPLGDGLDMVDVNTGGTTEPAIMTLAERYGADGAVFTTVREDQDAQFVSVQYKIYPSTGISAAKGRFVADTLPQAVDILIETLHALQSRAAEASASPDGAYVYDAGEVDEYAVIEAAEENAVDPLVADSTVTLPSDMVTGDMLNGDIAAPQAAPASQITTSSSATVLPSQMDDTQYSDPQSYNGVLTNGILADPNAAYTPPSRSYQKPVATTVVTSTPQQPVSAKPNTRPSYARPQKTSQYAVIVELQPGDSWLQIQRRLRELPLIQDLRPVYLGSERAQVMLSVAAGEQEFRQTLRAAGFKVSDDWVLRYGG